MFYGFRLNARMCSRVTRLRVIAPTEVGVLHGDGGSPRAPVSEPPDHWRQIGDCLPEWLRGHIVQTAALRSPVPIAKHPKPKAKDAKPKSRPTLATIQITPAKPMMIARSLSVISITPVGQCEDE